MESNNKEKYEASKQGRMHERNKGSKKKERPKKQENMLIKQAKFACI